MLLNIDKQVELHCIYIRLFAVTPNVCNLKKNVEISKMILTINGLKCRLMQVLLCFDF